MQPPASRGRDHGRASCCRLDHGSCTAEHLSPVIDGDLMTVRPPAPRRTTELGKSGSSSALARHGSDLILAVFRTASRCASDGTRQLSSGPKRQQCPCEGKPWVFRGGASSGQRISLVLFRINGAALPLRVSSRGLVGPVNCGTSRLIARVAVGSRTELRQTSDDLAESRPALVAAAPLGHLLDRVAQ